MDKLNSFINLKDNILFTKLDDESKIELLNLILKEELEYRYLLEFDSNITFGIEVEFECKKHIKEELLSLYKKLSKYIELNNLQVDFFNENQVIKFDKHFLTKDGSLDNGFEIDSKVFRNTTNNWNDLALLLDTLNKYYIIKDTCGAHVHIGFDILENNNNYLVNFLRIWRSYENVLFRFAAGEYNLLRPSCFNYAAPRYETFNVLIDSKTDKKLCIYDRDIDADVNVKRYAVNFKHIEGISTSHLNTLEFRLANGTLNKTIWQNMINCYIKLLLYSKNPNYDLDTIEKRNELLKDKYLYFSEINYQIIYLEQALELADLIYDNNLDKIYFLKQYLKDGINCYKKKDKFVKVKSLTK